MKRDIKWGSIKHKNFIKFLSLIQFTAVNYNEIFKKLQFFKDVRTPFVPSMPERENH